MQSCENGAEGTRREHALSLSLERSAGERSEPHLNGNCVSR